MQWEYLVLERPRNAPDNLNNKEGRWSIKITNLNQLGADGWELITVAPRAAIPGPFKINSVEETWIFKRAIKL